MINEWSEQSILELRLGVFFGVLVLMCLAETLWPRRELIVKRTYRWANNLMLTGLNALVVRILFPTAAVGMAIWSQQEGLGLFNSYNGLPPSVTFLGAIIFLDFIIYFQHVLFHHLPLLWRLHKVHHADIDLDVTSGARFHPIEIILSLFIKMGAIIFIGATPTAVIFFEIILNATAMFNHSNINLPIGLDKFLRLVLVTPDMHRVHHSIDPSETNTNYGFNLPWWDYLFGTYKAQPLMGHEKMFIGLTEYRKPELTTPLQNMLRLPFQKKPEKIKSR